MPTNFDIGLFTCPKINTYVQIDWNQSCKCLLEILERGVNIGCFRQPNPFLTAMHINGVCNFYFDAYENIKHLTPNLNLRNTEMVEKHAQAAIDFIMVGVANRDGN